MVSSDSEKIALRFVECINAQDVEGLAALMTEDHTFIGHDEGDVSVGRETMKQGFAGYFEDFPEYRIHVSKVTRSGKDIAIVGTTTGSHIAPEIEAKETVIWIAKIRDGLVSEWRIFTDLDRLR
jgi:uncharacterized protein (TIGR02246 family)